MIHTKPHKTKKKTKTKQDQAKTRKTLTLALQFKRKVVSKYISKQKTDVKWSVI